MALSNIPVGTPNLERWQRDRDAAYLAMEQRVNALESQLRNSQLARTGLTDTGTVGGVATPASADYTFSQQEFRAVGKVVAWFLRFQYTGATITVPANGNITNQVIGTVDPAWIPASQFGNNGIFSASLTGPVVSGVISSSGNITIGAVGNGSIAYNNTVDWSIGGLYLLP